MRTNFITVTSNERDGVSNHQPYDCLLNGLFRRRSMKSSKLRVTGLCAGAGNSPVTGEFPAQMASNADNVSIWWRHHVGWRSYTCRPQCVRILQSTIPPFPLQRKWMYLKTRTFSDEKIPFMSFCHIAFDCRSSLPEVQTTKESFEIFLHCRFWWVNLKCSHNNPR